ncbi:MAG: tyrosine-type recombinase/integrase [Actinobacteria bacterium]|nr:tyrosine-type recombinase/integrase [Actinomycetota bacterium]
MARRERGSGSVYKDPNRPGRWVGEVVIDGKRRRVSARNKTDVQAKLRDLITKRDSGQLVVDRRITVAEIVATFMERELPNMTRNGRPLAPSTIETYEWAAKIVTAEIGSVKLAALTVATVEAMLDRLVAKRKMSKASVVKLRSKLSQFIGFAERRGQIQRNVAKLASLPPKAADRQERNSLTPDQARALLAVLRTSRNGAMFGLSLLLGLRPGEAAGLWWRDIDLKAEMPTVNVTRGLQLDRGASSISDDLKTTKSKRTLALTPLLVTWLSEHKKAQAKERLAADRWVDQRLVFTTRTGATVDPKESRRLLAEACKAAEVPVMRPNELRHSCASLLADEGVAHELIADLLGHATTRMVEQTYRHRLRPVVDVATRANWSQTS